MKGSPAVYLGQIVSKDNFRAFIYAPDGSQKLAESWDEFESHMQSGLWFATREDAKDSKPKRVRNKPAPKVDDVEVVDDEPLIEEELIKDDDFLPKG